ncbi:MAG: TonB-dependent receptor [Gammaproteobacteria bacterium]|nr:TonB-dependent receptor [Gammaproteobacteria bacterium]
MAFRSGAGAVRVRILMLGTLACIGMPATAQDDETDDSDIEVVVVTAKFQRSLASAITQKQLADTQIEAIGIEDIGVLPAVSIADAIATLPGIAGARTDDGTISQLSVRGTTDLAVGLLNGREQVTVATTRNVEYGLYPPGVMSSVQVHKTPRASLPEGGLSGVINMNTIRPLDFNERSITINGEMASYALADDVIGGDDFGGQGSITFIEQLSDELGIAVAAAYASELLGRHGDVTPFDWQPFAGGFGAPADVDGDGVFGEAVVPAGFNIAAAGGVEDRGSLFGALQWKTDNVDAYADLLMSNRGQDFENYGVNFIGLTGRSWALVNPVVTVREEATTADGVPYDEYGQATITVPGTNASGFGSGGSSSYNQLTVIDQDILSTGVNLKVYSGAWTLEGDVSYSSAEHFFDGVWATVHGAPSGGFGGPVFTLTYSALGDTPTLSVAENLLDPSIWVPRQFELNDFGNDDQQTAFRAAASRDLNDTGFTSVSFGARLVAREKNYERIENRFTAAYVPDDPTDVLDDSFVRGTIDTDNGPSFLAWDVGRLESRFSRKVPQSDAALPPPLARNTQLLESGAIEEDSFAAYAQLDFESTWADMPVHGNLGLRYVSTELVAPGWTTPQRETVAAMRINPENDYTEVLPSVNVAFDVAESQKLRLGVSRVMNRAPLDDMRSSEAIFISGFGANGNAGNPMLQPTVANQLSVSYEWYPAEATSFVIAAYNLDLDSFIGTDFVVKPVIDVGSNPVDVTFQTTANGDGGYIRGYEFAANTTFGFVNSALDSLGTSFNYAYTDSDVLPVAPAGQGVALTGLSERVWNLALWWVGGNIEARVGWDYRSEYVEPNVFGNFLHVDETLLTSFQVSYDINEDLRVGVFGRNVGDEVRRKYTFNIPERTEFNNYYRTTYGVKVFYQL